jgi:P27 family predicted phage terminase small subunit
MKPTRSDAKPPKTLSVEARRRWRELQQAYAITDPAGMQILSTGLEAFDRMKQCQAAIGRDGMTITDRFGQPKAHPLLAAERDARAQYLAALKSLNFDLEPIRDRPGRPKAFEGVLKFAK